MHLVWRGYINNDADMEESIERWGTGDRVDLLWDM